MRSEFDFIKNIKDKYGLGRIGDDCAILPKNDETDLLISSDMLVEDIDFRLDWTTPESLGHKALTVSLSDIAAMGGTPTFALLSIAIPEHLWPTDFLDRFYAGYHSHAKRSRVELVGGDVSRSPETLVIDSIVLGEVPKGGAILRSGAKRGDAIIVTFRLGGAGGGLRLLEQGERHSADLDSWKSILLDSQLRPWPQLGTGPFLQRLGFVNSMIDISDGLSSDLMHICQASGVGARINADKIPINLNLPSLTSDPNDQLDLAVNAGEDYQLLFTVPDDKVDELSSDMIGDDSHGLFTAIGRITPNVGVIELVRDNVSEILEPKGYRHF